MALEPPLSCTSTWSHLWGCGEIDAVDSDLEGLSWPQGVTALSTP